VPRPLRDEQPGTTYHVISRAVADTRLVRDDSDRRRLLVQLQTVAESLGWTCLAVCVLDTSYHLVVTISDANLARGMQRLNGTYAQFFNRKYGRKGHLFGARYSGARIVTPTHLRLVIRSLTRSHSRSSITSICARRPAGARGMLLRLAGAALLVAIGFRRKPASPERGTLPGVRPP
jgi:REP-associated tyrosine transposase